MKKIVVTEPHLFMAVVGPSGCGKTYLLKELLVRRGSIFKPNFDRIIYFYQHWQNIYHELQLAIGSGSIVFRPNIDWHEIYTLSEEKRNLLIFDDVFADIGKSDEFLNLAVSGRHRNLHVIYLKHNLYQKSQNAKTIDLNVTHLLLLKNPRDIVQIDYLGRQLGCRSVLLSAYKQATDETFGHLLIDLDPRCSELLRLSSRIHTD